MDHDLLDECRLHHPPHISHFIVLVAFVRAILIRKSTIVTLILPFYCVFS
jgi:hypothetical protein